MDSISLTIVALSIIVLLYLSAWFSRAETALTLTTSAQIASMSEAGINVSHLIYVKKDLNRAIVAILIGNNVVNVMLSALTALVANAFFRVWGVTVAVGILTFVLIVFGEITPKSHAVMSHERVAVKNSHKLYVLLRVLGPVISFLMMLSDYVLRAAGERVERNRMLFSDDAIKDLATLGEQEGAIKPIEKDIIHNVFSFGDLKIRDIMLPIEKVVTVKDNTDIEKAKQAVIDHGYTRIPVEDVSGDIIGVMYSKDILAAVEGAAREWMREPFYIPESEDITTVFDQMKRDRVHIGIVRDKDFRVIGIVTLEDIIEELVGSIRDEFYEQHKG
ncbi:MAG TPA: hemolysin family protein [Candidatus Methanofastidiosa archaeon]|nr:hemolysin family protein [Candidatus Methanofastidiosa archaeon]HPR41155.1 hemolysin family protein [Candidatus Methanofastidiosa archaeon]